MRVLYDVFADRAVIIDAARMRALPIVFEARGKLPANRVADEFLVFLESLGLRDPLDLDARTMDSIHGRWRMRFAEKERA